jgi:sugar phosphate isomerase/epimerase
MLMAFQLSLNTSTIRTTPILDKIRIAADVGFTAIELWHDDIDQFVSCGGSLEEISTELSRSGLTLATTIYLGDWFDSQGESFKRAWQECRRRMEQSAQLGSRYIIAGPPGGEADYQLGASRYRELLELGKEIGVTPAMEFLGFVDQLNTIEDAISIIEGADHPLGCTVLDPFHIYRGGGTVESIAKLTQSQIAIAHFMDTLDSPQREQQHDAHRAYPGDGCFDLVRYLTLLEQVGYEGPISLELFREDLWAADPVAVCQTGFRKMQAVVDQVGH